MFGSNQALCVLGDVCKHAVGLELHLPAKVMPMGFHLPLFVDAIKEEPGESSMELIHRNKINSI